MNISTKFFTSAALLSELSQAILVGNTVVVQQIKNTAQERSESAIETIKAALEAENALKSEIIVLKDIVLFERKQSEIEKFQNSFSTLSIS